LNKSIGILLSIILTNVLVAVAITVAFFSFIVTVQAELKGVSSEKIELLSSKPTKDNENDISYQSTIKEVEKNTLYENFTVYEGLGIKFENSNNWTIIAKSDKSSCENINLCFLHLGIINISNMPQLWVIQDNFESQTITEYCKCNTLEDYVKYFNDMISQFDNISFINENQTTFPVDISAIQLEYEFSSADTKIHTFTIFTKNNNNDSFYQFSYYADPESFSNYLSDFKKIIETVEFAP
jgi:hypothetical protein